MTGCRGITSKYAPKPTFLKQRAVALHRSGYGPAEISRMLQISDDTAKRWTRPDFQDRRYLNKAIARAERETVHREPASVLPTLPYVPHIEPGATSKYRMTQPHEKTGSNQYAL